MKTLGTVAIAGGALALGLMMAPATTPADASALSDVSRRPLPLSEPVVTPTPAPLPLSTDGRTVLIENRPIIETLAPEAFIETDRLEEDEEGWDCRTMGNTRCGVDIMGTWYVVDFIDGHPSAVYAR